VRLVRTIPEVRAALAEPRRAGETIGLVPTMGAFHEGHLSLMRQARADCDLVVVSLFVNPSQFNESSDLSAYPRDEARDAALAAEEGVDLLFAPAVEELYPGGFATTVSVAGLTEGLEGVHRGRAHFDGVATIVTKLLNIVAPDVAYFGQKDAQQAIVIKRFVSDLDIPTRIEVCPTVREPDGLAMSSRNARLDAEQRARAGALFRALRSAEAAVAAGERDPAAVQARARAELDGASVEPEYLELVSAHTLAPVTAIDGEVLAVLAARVGNTRLIDNHLIAKNGRHRDAAHDAQVEDPPGDGDRL
jgi:pantoate--beta-alanine ligase